MDGYQVDLQQLSVLIGSLTSAADRISSANDLLREATPGQLGSYEIDQAGRAFQDRWEYGTGKIAEGVGHLVGALQQTHRTYQQAEEQASRLFSGGSPDSVVSMALDGGGS